MSYQILKIAPMLCAGALLAVPTSSAFARPKPQPPFPTSVNCDAGGSINAAIADGYTVITVAGECAENVTISTDNIALFSHETNRGEIRPPFGLPLNINNADGVSVNDLEIEALSGGNAVIVTHAQANFTGVDLIGGTAYALEARNNASVSFHIGTISGSTSGALANFSSTLGLSFTTISDVETLGATSAGGSHLRLSNTAVDGSGVATDVTGVAVSSGSSAEIASGSTVSGFGLSGVSATGGAVRIFGATISGNGAGADPLSYPGKGGVIVGAGSSLTMVSNAIVTGNTGDGVAVIDGSGGNCSLTYINGNDTDLNVSAGSEFSQNGSCLLPPP